jgi:hypothetical protein
MMRAHAIAVRVRRDDPRRRRRLHVRADRAAVRRGAADERPLGPAAVAARRDRARRRARADGPARGGALLPAAIYDTSASGGDYDSLRAVAFRLDPCFGQLGEITAATVCQAQLRVVFQPLTMEVDGTPLAQDAAVHAFYALTGPQLIDAVNELSAAREADAGSADLGRSRRTRSSRRKASPARSRRPSTRSSSSMRAPRTSSGSPR